MPYDPEVFADEGIPLSDMSLHTNYVLWIVIGLLITGMFSYFLYRKELKFRRAKSENIESAVTEGSEEEREKQEE